MFSLSFGGVDSSYLKKMPKIDTIDVLKIVTTIHMLITMLTTRIAQLVAAWQPSCEKMER